MGSVVDLMLNCPSADLINNAVSRLRMCAAPVLTVQKGVMD